MKILVFRMRTGEDVIAKITGKEVKKGQYFIEDPAVPVTERDQTGQERLHLIKWAPYAKKQTFKLEREDYVSTPYEAAKEIEDIYLQATSGLAIAGAGALNG